MNKSYFFDEPKSHTSLSQTLFYVAFGDEIFSHGGLWR